MKLLKTIQYVETAGAPAYRAAYEIIDDRRRHTNPTWVSGLWRDTRAEAEADLLELKP